MVRLLKSIFSVVRLVSALTAVLGIAGSIGTHYGTPINTTLGWTWLESVYGFLTWTPVFVLSLVIVGTWVSAGFEALTYRLEGTPTFWGSALLWARLRFTRTILHRPAWYSNDHRVQRDVSQANTALRKAGFAVLDGLPTERTADVSFAVDYLNVAAAMIWALGAAKAASLSHGVKKLVLLPIAARQTAEVHLPAAANAPADHLEPHAPDSLLERLRRLIGVRPPPP